MRRKDRQTDTTTALSYVDKCEYAVLSMANGNEPYALPLSIARCGSTIYFHSAKSGKKTEILKDYQKVCLVCVGQTHRLTDKFTTEFESAIVFGHCEPVEDETQKTEALRLICQKYTPLNMADFQNAIKRSLDRTAVYKIEIQDITGKCKKYDAAGEEIKSKLF